LKGYNKNAAGTVELQSPNPWDVPRINFKSFYEGDPKALKPDMDAMIEGVEFARAITAKHNEMLKLDGFQLVEESPGPDIDTRQEISDWVDQEAWGHHACCTASIGTVIDEKFRVKEAKNLRVVDASIFPKIPGTFIVLPTYMVSEHAADVILAAE
jgi:choline dehydrogenase